MATSHPFRHWSACLRTAASASLVLLAVSNAAFAATLEEIKSRGYMIVATEDDFKPF